MRRTMISSDAFALPGAGGLAPSFMSTRSSLSFAGEMMWVGR